MRFCFSCVLLQQHCSCNIGAKSSSFPGDFFVSSIFSRIFSLGASAPWWDHGLPCPVAEQNNYFSHTSTSNEKKKPWQAVQYQDTRMPGCSSSLGVRTNGRWKTDVLSAESRRQGVLERGGSVAIRSRPCHAAYESASLRLLRVPLHTRYSLFLLSSCLLFIRTFRIAVPFWEQTAWNLTGLSPKTGLRF